MNSSIEKLPKEIQSKIFMYALPKHPARYEVNKIGEMLEGDEYKRIVGNNPNSYDICSLPVMNYDDRLYRMELVVFGHEETGHFTHPWRIRELEKVVFKGVRAHHQQELEDLVWMDLDRSSEIITLPDRIYLLEKQLGMNYYTMMSMICDFHMNCGYVFDRTFLSPRSLIELSNS